MLRVKLPFSHCETMILLQRNKELLSEKRAFAVSAQKVRVWHPLTSREWRSNAFGPLLTYLAVEDNVSCS